ncbi:cation:dicarboxylate symporter family transporter [Aeromonas sp. 82P]|uniref:cation:dicarboxylate symporter family transporter n=1 Tax=Aeromonas TaxID=642 RepID=UPI0023646B60|nr:cation:dicarboxylase symporter family transporter [Aeromonas veronii]MDD1844884.1 cation:dicarboxylase symporter family transporter [Aeromonas veronii]
MMFVLIASLVFCLLCFALTRLPTGLPLSRKVLAGLLLGALFGLALQLGWGADDAGVQQTLEWVNIVGGGYVSLLKVVMMPLVFTSILSAINKLEQAQSLGKISAVLICSMLTLVMIAGVVGMTITHLSGLTAAGLLSHGSDTAALQQSMSTIDSAQTLPALLLSLVPTNFAADMAGSRGLSVIGVVIFTVLAGVALLQLKAEHPQAGARAAVAIDTLQLWVMKMVRVVIALTPYGVMALIVRVVAHYPLSEILSLLGFILVCYVAILAMFAVHMVILLLIGQNPLHYLREVWGVLTFAFVSRSSAASIPLSIETQQRLGVPSNIANFAASFGANLGQNGCAGIYPAMMVAMIAPMLGINPFDPLFLLTLLPVIALGSIGVAGVGGGGTFAALIVLSTLNFPIALVGVMIAIEPLVDMGRTALNVNGSIMAAMITKRLLGKQQLAQAEQPQEQAAS